MPPSRTDKENRSFLIELVCFPFRTDEGDAAFYGIAYIDLTLDGSFPRRSMRVFKVGHEHLCARIERIDDHLPVNWTRDLDASLLKVRRYRSDCPCSCTDML